LIRVLIADDHAVVRRGLTEILVRELEGAVCDEAENAEQAITKVRDQDWDLLILDIAMPGRSGLDVLRDIRLECRSLPVLIFSMHAEDQYARRMIEAGARG
jgi:DNA-binding NarL/FixJ family response regulator